MTNAPAAPNLNDPQHNPLEVAKVTDQFVVELHTEDSVVPLFATEDEATARQFIDGQFSNKVYGFTPQRLVHALPAVTFYYSECAKISYGSDGPVRTWPMEDAGFRGLFPREQPVNEPTSSLTGDTHTGWVLKVSGWDRDQVKAEFKSLLDEALALRATRKGMFAGDLITPGTVIRTEDGDVLMRIRPKRVATPPYWLSTRDEVIPDSQVDLSSIEIITKG